MKLAVLALTHAVGLLLPRGGVREALLQPVADRGEGDVLLTARGGEAVEDVQGRQLAVLGEVDRLAEHDHTEVVQVERIRVVARVRVGRAADVTLGGVAVGGNAGVHIRGQPDLGVRRGGLGAVPRGEEEGGRQKRAAATPQRVALGVLRDHQGHIGMPVAVELAVGNGVGGAAGQGDHGEGCRDYSERLLDHTDS